MSCRVALAFPACYRVVRGCVNVRVRGLMGGASVVSCVHAVTASACLWALGATAASADTLKWALTQAYINNPTLNAQRASVRATDETVPQALSGYRPRVSLSASVGEQYLDSLSKTTTTTAATATSPAKTTTTYSDTHGALVAHSYGGTISQTIFNGFGTSSRTRQAEQLVSAARETLRLDRADRAAQRGNRLHEPDPRRSDPRSAAA